MFSYLNILALLETFGIEISMFGMLKNYSFRLYVRFPIFDLSQILFYYILWPVNCFWPFLWLTPCCWLCDCLVLLFCYFLTYCYDSSAVVFIIVVVIAIIISSTVIASFIVFWFWSFLFPRPLLSIWTTLTLLVSVLSLPAFASSEISKFLRIFKIYRHRF